MRESTELTWLDNGRASCLLDVIERRVISSCEALVSANRNPQ
jgi:hypothetical protein